MYDVLLTQAEIQGYINKLNGIISPFYIQLTSNRKKSFGVKLDLPLKPIDMKQ